APLPTAPTPRAARRPAADPPTHRPPPSPTLARFYAERFEPEYVRLQKAATQVSYDSIYRNHIAPRLGALPIAAIDEDRLSSFRAALRRDLDVGTTNLVLSKVGRILRFAKKIRLLDTLPEIEKLALPRARPKPVLDDDEVARLIAAAAAEGPVTELIVLLALDAGLRSGEICALEWADVDLRRGAILIQNNTYRGRKQTPKGTIGKIALTDALWRALAEHRERGLAAGPLVLYRRSFRTGHEWRPHTAVTLRDALNAAQERAGLPKTGPHLLRHTALTRLANLGASVFMVQAVARHSRLQTTQTYLHTQQCDLAREAASLLNQAARHPATAPGFGKVLAKPAPPPENTVPGPARPRN
ncbi:MAG TPA: site-specific integrase, partial [Nannocystaceae bacterium]|nr:site-specific integrase [Nannocystaceae bacterium]